MRERIEKLIKHELLPVVAAKDVAIMAEWDSPKNQAAVGNHFEYLKTCLVPHIKDDTAVRESIDLFAFRLAAEILRGQGHFSQEIVKNAIDKAWIMANRFDKNQAPKPFVIGQSVLGGPDVLT